MGVCCEAKQRPEDLSDRLPKRETPTQGEKVRTYLMHKQKPMVRYQTRDEDKSDVVEALQAVVDTFRETDSLLLAQCRAALEKAKTL